MLEASKTRVDRTALPREKTSGDRGASLFGGLVAPLRLPERALQALEGLTGAVGTLAELRADLAAVREQTKPLGELVPLTKGIKRQIDSLPAKVDGISDQAEPLEALLPTLERIEQGLEQRLESLHELIGALEGEESHLNKAVEALGSEVAAMHKTVAGLQEDVQSATERLPDASNGPLEKARDVLTGGPAEPSP